jgi:hypothetical protein
MLLDIILILEGVAVVGVVLELLADKVVTRQRRFQR